MSGVTLKRPGMPLKVKEYVDGRFKEDTRLQVRDVFGDAKDKFEGCDWWIGDTSFERKLLLRIRRFKNNNVPVVKEKTETWRKSSIP